MAASRTSHISITAQERRARAVALRRAGVSFADIASQLGISKSAAHKTVSKALAELHAELTEQAHLLQAQEADRLDYAQARLAPQIAAGHLGAIDRLLRIMERRARLLGLDQPTKVAPTTPDGAAPYDPHAMSPAERAARIAELERKRRDADPA